jgi:excisionase family DNA binding protein
VKLLTAPEVAAIIRSSPWMVYQYAKRGTLPSVAIGGRVLFSEEALQEFIRTGGSRGAPQDHAPRELTTASR